MAEVSNRFLSLADTLRGGNRRGMLNYVEMLLQYNPAVADAHLCMCNDGSKHVSTIRAGLPEVTWRALYQGVQPSKGQEAEVSDTTGYVESWSEVDARLVEKDLNGPAVRMRQAQGHIQAMTNEIERTIFYGNEKTHARRFTGLSARFNSLDSNEGTASQIIDAGGTGSDNTSIWLVTWGDMFLKMIYPEGSMGGLEREDVGKDTKTLPDGSNYLVYRERFGWDAGISLTDFRGISRIANIDVSNLSREPGTVRDGASSADLYDLLTDATHALWNPGQGMGRTVIYANKRICTMLDKQSRKQENLELTIDQVEGKRVTSFRGIPIHRADSLLETETRIVA